MNKACFPIYHTYPGLVYWDSAASGLKLGLALDVEYDFLRSSYANVNRGVYHLSAKASMAYEEARMTLAHYFNCDGQGFVFVRGATEGINLFAASVVAPTMKSGQNIVITQLEHHSNILIWRAICREKNGELRVIPLDAHGQIDKIQRDRMIDHNTHLVAMTHASNVTGVINDLSWIEDVQKRGIWTLIDGAQMAAHYAIDVRSLQCDAYVVSAHKMYGPCGIGAVMLSEKAREVAHPYQRGGGMVAKILDDHEVFLEDPYRFEAGTPHISGAIGFAETSRWLKKNLSLIHEKERKTFRYLLSQWQEHLQPMHVWCDPAGIGILAFDIDGVHPHDLATFCDIHGVAIRAGHHCASPLIRSWGKQAVARLSIGAYNDEDDVDQLITVLKKVRGV